MENISDRLASLNLSPLDKRRLRDALDLELTGTSDSFSDNEIAVWEGVRRALHISLSLSSFMQRSKYGKRAYADDVWQIEQFINLTCGKLTRIERMSVMATVVRCLMRYVSDEDERVTPEQLLRNSYLVEQAVEDQYPGYADAGLLRSCLIRAPIEA